jgi:hypothetical protein
MVLRSKMKGAIGALKMPNARGNRTAPGNPED